jgi:transposase
VAHSRNVRPDRREPEEGRPTGRASLGLARIDPQLLSPIQHRSVQVQADLSVIRAIWPGAPTSVKVHPDGTGALKKNGPQAIGKSRGGWNTKIHLVAADARTAITFALSPGHAHDAPEGRELLHELGRMPEGLPLLMDRAYEGDETRQLVLSLGMVPVVPPKSNRIDPWRYDRTLYKKRNEIERLFRRMKGYRRIFSRFEKLDVVFLGFLAFAFIVEALR